MWQNGQTSGGLAGLGGFVGALEVVKDSRKHKEKRHVAVGHETARVYEVVIK